ncbi:DUF7829 domain-containing protein [Tenacibaculum finnmarkense]|uniref:DUF7829 domain-containing protein n=1 Tax=Tenacibaculum finnmarkense genomovar ulcerans TaxID=2781388 RepID=A0A2I2MBE8_9FLAO|nr:hypothetical protein [Tenacibaculum finnmarkense]MBE7698670.1 hypothetical protein [Tenacibaculum finnmarkense genomovar ulcerans]MCG8808920.1 hypothetical protein [Tenacibaculum finnmarkense]MCG8819160.1 hypothetical protein [Tenacibaculum finnmarkense]SOU89868.1 hypothetical protein TNO010_520257 [Tenacibaculum finnmarkense genomovar ulcerans]
MNWKEKLYSLFLEEFPEYYEDSKADYFQSGNLPGKLNTNELKKLHEEINIPKLVGCEKHLILHKLLNNRTKDKFTFYLLARLELECDVNSYDKEKNTVFMKIAKRYFEEEKYFGTYYFSILFKRGYKIKEEDIQFVLDLYHQKKSEYDFGKWTTLRYATKLNDLNKFEKAMGKTRELDTILSFKMNRPIGVNFPNLLGVAINSITNYRENGDVILKSIDKFKQTNKINVLDKKKNTFKRKRQEYLENKPTQDKEFEKIAIELFPELE